MDRSLIASIERAALDAVPALERVRDRGWVLQAGLGLVGRINSVTTLTTPIPDAEAIERVEAWYQRRGFPPSFRLTPADDDLLTELDRRGYGTDRPEVSVMHGPVIEGQPELPHQPEPYLESLERAGERGREIIASYRLLDLPDRVVAIDVDGTVVARGRAVLGGAWVGIFDLVTEPDQRRRGLGRTIVSDLLRWGHSMGATRSYLQVVASNEPAVGLYRSFGFREAYVYRYRTALPRSPGGERPVEQALETQFHTQRFEGGAIHSLPAELIETLS